MTGYFLDTSFLIALESADDQFHKSAIAAWQKIRTPRAAFVTTSYVLDEVATFFNSRGHHAKAVSVGELLLSSDIVTFVHVNEEMFAEAWRELSHHADKRYSLTDCVSFVVMKRMRITSALSFDRHFTQAGFERLP